MFRSTNLRLRAVRRRSNPRHGREGAEPVGAAPEGASWRRRRGRSAVIAHMTRIQQASGPPADTTDTKPLNTASTHPHRSPRAADFFYPGRQFGHSRLPHQQRFLPFYNTQSNPQRLLSTSSTDHFYFRLCFSDAPLNCTVIKKSTLFTSLRIEQKCALVFF